MDTVEEIVEFIRSKQTYGALLLTGAWGSGKSYQMRLVAHVLNNGEYPYAMVLISLFGVESVSALESKIRRQVFSVMKNPFWGKVMTPQVDSIKKKTQAYMKALADFHQYFRGLGAILSINPYDFVEVEKDIDCYIGGVLKSKELVLVFDDLERSQLKMVELLGVINEYSENKGIKTILIANEDVMTEQGKENTEYSIYKEKSISKTIWIKADYPQIIKNLIENYQENCLGYRGFLKANSNIIVDVFMHSETSNIRTIISLLSDFERVYRAWITNNIPIGAMPCVLYSFGALLFEHRAGIMSKTDGGIFYADNRFKEKYPRFNIEMSHLNSLQDWVTESVWSEKLLIEELVQRYGMHVIPADRQFLLANFWELDDRIVEEGLPLVLERAYDGELTCDELIILLRNVHAMQKYNIRLPEPINYTKMLCGFEKREKKVKEGFLIEPIRRSYSNKEDIDQEAIDLYKRIEAMGDKVVLWDNRLAFIAGMKGDKSVDLYKFRQLWFEFLDEEMIESFIEAFKGANNSQKRNLANIMLDMTFKDTSPEYSGHNQTQINARKLIKLLRQVKSDVDDGFSVAITQSLMDGIKKKWDSKS